jgi:hypothetical protein
VTVHTKGRISIPALEARAFFRAGVAPSRSALGASTLDSNPRVLPGLLVEPARD